MVLLVTRKGGENLGLFLLSKLSALIGLLTHHLVCCIPYSSYLTGFALIDVVVQLNCVLFPSTGFILAMEN